MCKTSPNKPIKCGTAKAWLSSTSLHSLAKHLSAPYWGVICTRNVSIQLPILKAKFPAQNIELIQFSISGDLAKVEQLLSLEHDINVADANGVTSLIAACAAGHFEVVKYLVSKGADLTLKDNLGYDAYHTAMIYGDFKGVASEPFASIMSVVKYI